MPLTVQGGVTLTCKGGERLKRSEMEFRVPYIRSLIEASVLNAQEMNINMTDGMLLQVLHSTKRKKEF